jgi:hypothetical protein
VVGLHRLLLPLLSLLTTGGTAIIMRLLERESLSSSSSSSIRDVIVLLHRIGLIDDGAGAIFKTSDLLATVFSIKELLFTCLPKAIRVSGAKLYSTSAYEREGQMSDPCCLKQEGEVSG